MTANTKPKPLQTPENFSDEESFGLFMEALRDLQVCADYSESEEPDAAKIEYNLNEARQSLETCCRNFPEDLLPRFYLGITLTTINH